MAAAEEGEIEADTFASRSSLSKLMTVSKGAEVEGSVAGGTVWCVKPTALMDALCKPPAAYGEKGSLATNGAAPDSDCGHAVMHTGGQRVTSHTSHMRCRCLIDTACTRHTARMSYRYVCSPRGPTAVDRCACARGSRAINGPGLSLRGVAGETPNALAGALSSRT